MMRRKKKKNNENNVSVTDLVIFLAEDAYKLVSLFIFYEVLYSNIKRRVLC